VGGGRGTGRGLRQRQSQRKSEPPGVCGTAAGRLSGCGSASRLGRFLSDQLHHHQWCSQHPVHPKHHRQLDPHRHRDAEWSPGPGGLRVYRCLSHRGGNRQQWSNHQFLQRCHPWRCCRDRNPNYQPGGGDDFGFFDQHTK